jgi:hypothetical protein
LIILVFAELFSGVIGIMRAGATFRNVLIPTILVNDFVVVELLRRQSHSFRVTIVRCSFSFLAYCFTNIAGRRYRHKK